MDEEPFTPDWFSKPGDSLRSLMQRRGVAAADVAERFDGGMTVVRGILDGSVAIDAEKAKALAESVGGTSDFWLKRQAGYEVALERAIRFAAAYEADEWLGRVPRPGAKTRGQLTEAGCREELRRRLVFFNVANMKAWETRYGRLRDYTRFRTSASFASSGSAVLLWLRRGEQETDLIPTRTWNPGNLQDRLDAIRKLTRVSRPERFLPKLRALCADAGVALVVERAPKGCYASGAEQNSLRRTKR